MPGENPETLILGMQWSDAALSLRSPLYWDQEKGDEGYHSIRWEKIDDEFRIKDRTYVWGTAHEEQAGVVLPEICGRDPENWLWAREPVTLFPGAHGYFMRKDLADKLNQLFNGDAFSGLVVCEELHGRPVVLGFATVDTILSKISSWHDPFQASTDTLLRTYLATGSDNETVQMTEWLRHLATTEHKEEQAALRYLLTHPMTDKQFVRWCDWMGPTYEMYDREAGTGLVKRTLDGREIIVPEDKMFARPENARKALDELREHLKQ